MTAPTIKRNAAKKTLDQRAPSRNVNASESITVYRNALLMSGHIHNFSAYGDVIAAKKSG